MTQETRPLGAQISHMLKNRGVEVIFGVPGVHNQEMYRGIEEAGLRHVLSRHEQGAGFMADGYARASGKPGVCYVISGPGLCNIMTPMGQAYSDSVPMLVISSCLEMAEKGLGRGRLHEMKDQEGAAGAVCDWSYVAQSPQVVYELFDRAMREFFCGKRAPKHIQVPISQLETMAPAYDPLGFKRGEGRRIPDPLNVLYTASMLKKAKKPLIIFGGGAIDAAGPKSWDNDQKRCRVRDLLDVTQAASFTTYAGRGIVKDDDPRHFGSTLARPDSAKVAAQADLVLVIGSRLSEVDLWRESLGHTATMIRVDVDQTVLNGHGGAFFNIEADAFSFVDGATERTWRAQSLSRLGRS